MKPESDSPETDWVSLLAPESLERFLRSALGVDAILSVRGRAQSGSSNITAFVDFGRERLVVRRPPKGELLPTAHDMSREAGLLLAAGGAHSVANARELEARLRGWLSDSAHRKVEGARARGVVEHERGGTARSVRLIEQLLG